MSLLWFEFTLALRRLWRRRAQSWLMLATLTISLTLALLSWSLYYTVFRYNPPCDPHGRLYVVTYAGGHALSSVHATQREFQALHDGQQDFSDFAEMVFYESVFVDTTQGIERVLAAHLSSAACQLVGVQPELGRPFRPAEDVLGGPLALLLSHRAWQNWFGGDPGIVGRIIKVNDNPTTIVGVMPADFRFPNDQDVWLAMSSANNSDYFPYRDGLARLRPGVSPRRAEADLQVILSRLGPASPANQRHYRTAVIPYREFYLDDRTRVSAFILFSLALLFVVVGCVNAANLILIDFLGRQAELAATLALGIPRRAAIRGVFCQVGVITALATGLSLGLLVLIAPFLHQGLMQVGAPYWLKFSLGMHHIGMAVVLAVLAAGMALVAPVAYLLCLEPEHVIREYASASRGAGHARARRYLLTGQMAILTVLGVCAGLLVRSSLHLDAGRGSYDARDVFTASISSKGSDALYGRLERYAGFHRVLDGVKQLPGIRGAAYMQTPIGFSTTGNCAYALDPGAFSVNQPLGRVMGSLVTDQLFATLDVPFVHGATFPHATPPPGSDYAVINESLAARLWPGQDPIQRVLYTRDAGADPRQPPNRLVVVGVVRDFQAAGPMAAGNDFIYTPLESLYWWPNTLHLFARGPVAPAAAAMIQATHRFDPRMTIYFTSTIEQVINLTLSSVHLTTHLATLFALAAVMLCGIGVYSLTVSQILQSTREFGIRLALGGEPGALWRRFIAGHLRYALAGVVLGLVAAGQIARLLQALLFGVDCNNPATFAGVAVVIMAIAVVACVPSLFRLKRINPAECLRSL
jgi:predicted permease